MAIKDDVQQLTLPFDSVCIAESEFKLKPVNYLFVGNII